MYLTNATKKTLQKLLKSKERKIVGNCDKRVSWQSLVKGNWILATCVNVMSYPGNRYSEGSSNKAIAFYWNLTHRTAIKLPVTRDHTRVWVTYSNKYEDCSATADLQKKWQLAMCDEILNWIIVQELLTCNYQFNVFSLFFRDIYDSTCKCSTSSLKLVHWVNPLPIVIFPYHKN